MNYAEQIAQLQRHLLELQGQWYLGIAVGAMVVTASAVFVLILLKVIR